MASLRGWLVAGALACALGAQGALAQSTVVLNADIPSQPLPDALASFARQTALQLVYVSELANHKLSRGATAGLSAGAALTQLLAGTGIRFEFLNARTIRLVAIERNAEPGTPIAAPADSPAPPSAGPAGSTLADIIVTATRREEPRTAVPMSVGVLPEDGMRAAGVKGIDEIAALTPGVEYDFSSQFGSGILTNIAIRGISPSNGRATTGLYFGDVPINVDHTPFSNPYPFAFDLARVEVLRGPQGTLFGTGTSGGAIRFIPNEPSATASDGRYSAELSSTEHGDLSIEAGAAASVPIVPGQAAARISAGIRRDGGYIDRVDPLDGATVDRNANSRLSTSMRAGLVVAPNDWLRITPMFAYQALHIRDSPIFFTYLSAPESGELRNGKLLRQPAADQFSISSVKIEAQLPGVNLSSVTSYVDRSAQATVDQTNAAGVLYFGGFGNPLGPGYPTSYADAVATQLHARQILATQEVRASSVDSYAPLAWLAGLYYQRARQEATHTTYAVVAPQDIGIYSDSYTVETETAAFGHASLRLSPHWSAGAGVRVAWTQGEFTNHQSGFANTAAQPFSDVVGAATPTVTPRFSLSHQADGGELIYVSASKGLRSGGPNGNPPARCQGVPVPGSFAADSIWSYEIGSKDVLFDRRLQLVASVFYIRWAGVQLSVADACGNSYVGNAGAATSTGIDVTAELVPNDHVRLGIALGYDDAHYTRTVTVNGDVIAERGTVIGGLPGVPAPWSANVSAEYRRPIGPTAIGYVRAVDIAAGRNGGPFLESNPRSSSYDPTARPDPTTNRLNVAFGVIRGGVDYSLSVVNVFNSLPTLQNDVDAPGSSLRYAYTFRPRTTVFAVSRQF